LAEQAPESYISIKSPARTDPSPHSPFSPAATNKRRLAMAYGLSTRAFIEDGPQEQAAKAEVLRSTARTWRALDEAHRLALIELALKPANDRIDAYPLAL
jgi:hypothetical protein